MYSRRCPIGARKSAPKELIIPARWLGPTPSRKRPGARLSSTWTCCASATGCRDHVCTMDVPSRISSVTAAAPARTVTASPPAAARRQPGAAHPKLFEMDDTVHRLPRVRRRNRYSDDSLICHAASPLRDASILPQPSSAKPRPRSNAVEPTDNYERLC